MRWGELIHTFSKSSLKKYGAAKRLVWALVKDARGGVMVEYTVLIGAVAIAGSVGLIVVGIAVARNFEFVRGMLLIPIP